MVEQEIKKMAEPKQQWQSASSSKEISFSMEELKPLKKKFEKRYGEAASNALIAKLFNSNPETAELSPLAGGFAPTSHSFLIFAALYKALNNQTMYKKAFTAFLTDVKNQTSENSFLVNNAFPQMVEEIIDRALDDIKPKKGGFLWRKTILFPYTEIPENHIE